MTVSYATYLIVLALIVFGGHFAKGKGNIHQDATSLEVTKSLRGLAAIGVILHHISQQSQFQQANGWGKPGELSLFVNIGFFFVAIFLFWSGYGLIKSLNTKENYLQGFLKKRVLKTIVIPFYINIILYAIFNLATGVKLAPGRWVFNFLGLTMMNEYAWYPIVLTLLYLAFYFIFKNIKNRKFRFTLMFLVIAVLGVIFCFNGHFAWWAGPKNWWINSTVERAWWMEEKAFWLSGEWWVNSAIALPVGMIFAQNEEKIRTWFKKAYIAKLILIIICFAAFNFLSSMAQWKMGYWSEWNGDGPGIVNKLVCYVSQLPQVTLFVILMFAVLLKFHTKNPVLNFFGNISFETYMMNLMALDLVRPFIFKSKKGFNPITTSQLVIDEVAVIVLTIALALIYKWICKLITDRLFRPKTQQ